MSTGAKIGYFDQRTSLGSRQRGQPKRQTGDAIGANGQVSKPEIDQLIDLLDSNNL